MKETNNLPHNPTLHQAAVTCCGFSVGDKVNTPYAGVGIIWKITDDFIHVKHRYRKEGIEWLYTKYFVGETVYPQYSVSAISHCR